ncbi:unnamed protein product [Cuscuta campestris]|uniref:Uncharacterized protein n=1 Tax=Cuscuta campestris TaxID=132261 RepID=A0A484NEJ5_9ASTE|nr:unnamed protein product [Cuscuta campestris]
MEEKRNVNPIVFCDLTAPTPCQNSLFGTLSRNPPPLQTLDLLKNLGCSSSSSSPLGNKKHPHPDDNDRELEECEEWRRRRKQSAVYGHHVEEEEEDDDDEDDVELSEMFDRFLLCSDPNEYSMNIQPAAAGKRKEIGRVKHDDDEHNKSKNPRLGIDLSALLISCAKSIASYDHRTASEHLKEIRLHCSPSGNGDQRLAYVFAQGLEARLAGTTTPPVPPKKITAFDLLEAYRSYMQTCPFAKITFAFANKMIYLASSGAKTIHIIDFGILFGFQWPILIQHLSNRPGGPPRVRITGIELPPPGFPPQPPAQLVHQTGRRLAKYCHRFGVPFEYNGIPTRNWEGVRVEDLKLSGSGDEMVVVNCIFRFKDMLDESVGMENNPRDAVLRLIRKLNPNLFVHSIVNGSVNSPFFDIRFREALFHYNAHFDILEKTLPRDDPQRALFEQEFFGREAFNVVACDGEERVSRPETYKKWGARSAGAGFRILPLNPEVTGMLRKKVKTGYHKEFVFDEDCDWMLQGWKGRILCAASCWVPVFGVSNDFP